MSLQKDQQITERRRGFGGMRRDDKEREKERERDTFGRTLADDEEAEREEKSKNANAKDSMRERDARVKREKDREADNDEKMQQISPYPPITAATVLHATKTAPKGAAAVDFAALARSLSSSHSHSQSGSSSRPLVPVSAAVAAQRAKDRIMCPPWRETDVRLSEFACNCCFRRSSC